MKNFVRFFKYSLEFFFPWAVFRMVGGIASSFVNIANSYLLGQVVNVSTTKEWSYLPTIAAAIATCFIVRVFFSYFNSFCNNKYIIKTRRKVQGICIEKLYRLPYRYFDRKDAGELITQINDDTREIADFCGDSCGGILSYIPFAMILSLAVMLSISPVFTLIVGCMFPLLILLARNTEKNFSGLYNKKQVSQDRLNARFLDIVSGISLYKIYRTSKDENPFNEQIGDLKNADFEISRAEAKHRRITLISNVVPQIFIYAVGIFFIANEGMKVGDLLIFSQVFAAFVSAFLSFLDARKGIAKISGIANHLFVFLDAEEENAKESRIDGASDLVQFKDVSFSYQEKRVLEHLSFSAYKGQITTLVGESGCGKTTALRLIRGQYAPCEGEIYIQDRVLSDLDAGEISKYVGYVPQDVYIFTGTFMENIRMGNDELSDDEIIEITKKICLYNDIVGLPDGFHTLIGPGENLLSGGQRQKIALARAIVKDAPILLLDEPTSALDAESEHAVLSHLGDLKKDKIIIMVSHKESTIAFSDFIYHVEHNVLEAE